MRLHGAVVFLLLAFAQAVSAAAIGVSNAGQLRQALLDATVSSVVLQAPVTVDLASFPPINLGHAVTVTAASSADALSFSHTREPLIMVGPRAYLELHNLTLARFYPQQALGFTSASSMVPIAALNISATGAAIVLRSCKFLLQSPLADATGSMPFWAEQDQAGFNLLTANGQPAAAVQQFDLVAAKGSMQKSRLSAASMQQIAQLSSDKVYYGGSSTVSITNSLLVIDPQHCYTGQQQLVWDSNSLATALQDATVREVLVFVDIVLSPLDFSFTQSKLVSSMRISTCSGSPASLNFNMLSQAITLRPGAVLQLSGGLAVRQAAPMAPSISRTNTSNNMAPALQALMDSTPALLLLGSVDLSLGAELVVQSASVAVANTSQVWGAYQAVAEASWGQASRPLARQGQGQLGQEGSKISVGLWNTAQPSGSPSILRPVEIRGCHPDGPKGGRYTIDFSHLKGPLSLNVHSMLRFSGDLFLKGMPDRPGSSGSWVLNTGINLVGSGFLEYQGVVLEGYSPSLLLQPDNARWRALPALMPRKGSWMRLSETAVLLYQYLLPVVFAAGAASGGSFAGSVARGPSATAASGLLLQSDAETRLLAGFSATAAQPQVYSFSHHRPAVVTALTATTADTSNRGLWRPSDPMQQDPFPQQGSPPLLDDHLQDNLMHQQLPQYTAAAFFEQGQVTGEALLGAHLGWQPGFQQDRSHHPLDRSHQLSDRGERPGWPAADANMTATEEGTAGLEGAVGLVTGQHKQQLFEAARKQLGAVAGDLARSDALVLEAVLGEGTFGKVFKGYWKGTLVAVKTMMFPAAMSGKEKREKMAIMETAISASLSHPNIVQMYTYYLRPVLVGHEAQMTTLDTPEGHRLDSSSVGDTTLNTAFLSDGVTDMVHSWEVQLVLEYCDQGSLRQLLNKKDSFTRPDGSRDMELILDTALDVARAMLHLHSENIIHSDLKARNILLKSSGGADRRHFVAKVADFGLSMRIDPEATHVSNIYQGTLTHMAPEVMLHGKLSRGSDVYAFGVLLWELYSGGHAFKGIPRALLGHEVAYRQRRPHFPEGSPFDFQLLACR
eukprot:gene10053-10209_t